MTEKNRPTLKLIGEDGNAFAILGKARRIAKENNLDWKLIQDEATSGSYEHLLQIMAEHFEVI